MEGQNIAVLVQLNQLIYFKLNTMKQLKKGDFIKGGKENPFEGIVKQVAPYPNATQVLITNKAGDEQFVNISEIVATISK